ncbi:MAG: hypothetical protein GX308_07955 [Epulopiscium sp.]|nr:hypothetical protein [Candidatus Epulonipiscium sp.]
MKRKLGHSILILLAFFITAMFFDISKAMGSNPGSNQDPLVSKSYVDGQINALMDLVGGLSQSKPKEESNSMIYEVIEVSSGQTLMGAQGTEIILRGGKGIAITSPAGGLQDMTEGVDIISGQSIPKYHLIIIPKDDGRGIYVESDSYFMVRGKFDIIP